MYWVDVLYQSAQVNSTHPRLMQAVRSLVGTNSRYLQQEEVLAMRVDIATRLATGVSTVTREYRNKRVTQREKVFATKVQRGATPLDKSSLPHLQPIRASGTRIRRPQPSKLVHFLIETSFSRNTQCDWLTHLRPPDGISAHVRSASGPISAWRHEPLARCCSRRKMKWCVAVR